MVRPQPWGRAESSFGGKKWPNRALFICSGVSVPRREGKWVGAQRQANLCAVQRFWGVAESKTEHQCLFFATLIALKYPDLETFASSLMAMVPCLRATLAAL